MGVRIFFGYIDGVTSSHPVNTAVHNRPAEDAGIKTIPSLDVFPNPASDHIQLRLSRPVSGKSQIVVMNMLGKVYYSKYTPTQNSPEDQFTLNLPGIPEGQYMVVLRTDDFQQISQFTVLK
ncbi:MAG: T9SS type A sorting domain-containing protein [Saprospiraceae bacterium]|nr:T9SS type A sorting domain-containing protein [Saprospiraceae bacterium]